MEQGNGLSLRVRDVLCTIKTGQRYEREDQLWLPDGWNTVMRHGWTVWTSVRASEAVLGGDIQRTVMGLEV